LRAAHTRESQRIAELPFEKLGLTAQFTKVDGTLRSSPQPDKDYSALYLEFNAAHGLRPPRIERHGNSQQSRQLLNAGAISRHE
jgi:hypothetical protein